MAKPIKVHGLVRPGSYLVMCGRSPAYVTTANWKDVTCKDCLRKIADHEMAP